MSNATVSRHAPGTRRQPVRTGASRSTSPAARTSNDGLCRPLTAEELQIIRGGIPEKDFTPAA